MPGDTRGLRCKDVPIFLKILQIALHPEGCSSLLDAASVFFPPVFCDFCCPNATDRVAGESGVSLPSRSMPSTGDVVVPGTSAAAPTTAAVQTSPEPSLINPLIWLPE